MSYALGTLIAFLLANGLGQTTSEPPTIPADYKERGQLIEEGKLHAPTQVSYKQNLLSQPMELKGKTWQSGTRPQDRPDNWWGYERT